MISISVYLISIYILFALCLRVAWIVHVTHFYSSAASPVSTEERRRARRVGNGIVPVCGAVCVRLQDSHSHHRTVAVGSENSRWRAGCGSLLQHERHWMMELPLIYPLPVGIVWCLLLGRTFTFRSGQRSYPKLAYKHMPRAVVFYLKQKLNPHAKIYFFSDSKNIFF